MVEVVDNSSDSDNFEDKTPKINRVHKAKANKNKQQHLETN